MSERNDERFAREAFDRYLRANSLAERINWSRGSDPPDYLLDADGAQFAVEVTTITPQYQRSSRSPLSDIGFSAVLSCFTQDIRQRAADNGILNAHYLFHLEGPHGIFDECRDEIAQHILKFIRNDNDPDEIDMHEIANVRGYSVHMAKLNKATPWLSWGYGLETFGAAEEFISEFDSLIRNSIAEKREKLKDILLPKILLLIDQYSLLEPEYFISCPIVCEHDETFHSVYVVTSDQRAYPLWSTPIAA